MRHMSNLKSFKGMSLLFVGLMVVLALAPAWTQARVSPTISGPADGEGDPLDSNDYSSGGGSSDSDNDLHEQAVAPDRDLGDKLIRTLLVRDGVAFLPFFVGPHVNVLIIELPVMQPTAVEYAD